MDGCQWIVDAHGCEPARLADAGALAALFDRIVRELELRPVAPAQWHVFPAPGGITGVCLLAESHLSVHTFPEHGSLCLDLFCCRPRPEWDFAVALTESFGATTVSVRRMARRYQPLAAPAPARAGFPAPSPVRA